MLASQHSHLSDSSPMEHAESSHECSPLSHHSHNYCVDPQSSSSDVDHYARNFDCNICMHVCLDPVVTMCGHLFCWPCLYHHQLSLHSPSNECPVCKADVQDKVVPLYGCGKVGGYSTDSVAEKFGGIHIPCRPAATRWITPITSPNARRRREPNEAIQINEMHTPGLSGFCASILRFGMASLPPQSGGGFLCRYAQSAVSRLVHRRRFNNEKEFVLHWVFVCMASVATALFLAC